MVNITFEQLQVSPPILRSLDKMGFIESTPVQAAAIAPMLAGRDVMVQAPTGTGKTCAFGIPLVEAVDPKSPVVQALVLCPTRELAVQTTAALHKLTTFMHGVKVVAIYGGEPIEYQIRALRRRPQIIVATPGRIMDHMERRTVDLSRLNTIVLDEADRMLDMGFREDLDEILKSLPDNMRTALFSATLSKPVMEIAKTYQKEAVFIKIEADTSELQATSQFYTLINGRTKTPVLMKLLKEKGFRRSLVFVGTKIMAEKLTLELIEAGFNAEALHGDLRQRRRDVVMDKYRRGHLDILVATDVAARGIDVYNIDAVINYDIPQDAESYVHRIGRTGRAKKTGAAYTFIYNKEEYKLRDIMHFSGVKITPYVINVPYTPSSRRAGDDRENRGNRSDRDRVAGTGRRGEAPVQRAKKVWVETPRKAPKEVVSHEPEGIPNPNKKDKMFISLGNLDKLTRKQIVELIITQSNVPPKAIGQIFMHDKFSFFEVSPDYSHTVMKELCGKTYNKRKITVEASNGKYGKDRSAV